jgi:hypothetical protein
LRVSIVGIGKKNGNSLVEWFFNLPINSKIDGWRSKSILSPIPFIQMIFLHFVIIPGELTETNSLGLN